MADSIADITSLSDAKLRSELVRLGFQAGPVTKTTRSILQKKLLKLRSEQKKAPKRASIAVPSRKVLGFSSDESENDVRPTGTKTRQAILRRRSARGRLNTQSRRKGTKAAEESENESNDEENVDIDLPTSHSFSFLNRPNVRSKSTTFQPNDIHTANAQARPNNRSGTRLSSDYAENDHTSRSFSETNNKTVDHQLPKPSKGNSSFFSTQRIFGSQPANDNEFSDSDIGQDNEPASWKGKKGQTSLGLTRNDASVYNAKPNASNTRHSGTGLDASPGNVNKTFSVANDNGDKENDDLSIRRRRSLNSTPKTSTPRKLTPHSYDKTDVDVSLSSKPDRRKRNDISNVQGARYDNSTRNQSHHSSHSLLEQEFPTEENLSASLGSKYSHVISTVLLACAFIFFAVLGVLYISVGSEDNRPLICDGSAKYEQDEKTMLKAAQFVSDRLSERGGLFVCDELDPLKDGNMTRTEVIQLLEAEFMKKNEVGREPRWAEEILQDILERAIEKEWKFQMYNASGHKITDVNDTDSTRYLSTEHTLLPWLCRVRRSASVVLLRLTVIIIFVIFAWLFVLYLRYYWRTQELERDEVLAMVEKILDMLSKHHRACQNDTKNNHAYQAIPHIRDSIIAPAERQKKERIWKKAVQFINTHESRVRVETQRIEGEEFQVWRWVQASPSPHLTSFAPVMELEYNPNRVKVWQGTAFDNPEAAVKMRSYSPTECLKIRNMFDISLESSEHWEIVIEDAVMERCGADNGIVHVAADKNSTEGCVYVKFVSPEMAGQGFRKLHGSWFDGKLITVKFLRLERYHTRFPEAVHALNPIKPSNNLQKSLSVINRPSVGGEAT
ncbi:inner nuclear membrane protein Man1-like [Apostichopus japonicus]|uniref:inner nuclear membrane protein Man1-like n=1 Tax=Stichopus japonicus TaxID=307972 RepID=UPI003AB23D8A